MASGKHNLLFHTIDATTASAGRHKFLSSAPAPAWSAVGDAIRSIIKTARRIRHRVW